MPYNKDIHHRRSIRLKDYDYSQSGLYFLTICTQDRECKLGNIVNGEMVLNELGNEIDNVWKELPNHFPNIECDIYQIMPNHIHGIIIINKLTNASDKNVGVDARPTPTEIKRPNTIINDINNVWIDVIGADADIIGIDAIGVDARSTPTLEMEEKEQELKKKETLGDIVCAFKSLSVVRCLKNYKSRNETLGKLWQRNYYEHIIRTPQEYYKIANYIISNPYNWTKDELFEE